MVVIFLNYLQQKSFTKAKTLALMLSKRKNHKKLSIKYKKCKKNILIDCFILVLSNKFVAIKLFFNISTKNYPQG